MTPTRWACVVAALGVAAYLLLDPHSADLAAQQYRVDLVHRDGFGLWDDGWFAGHHIPGYSLLFPPLGALLGLRVAGAASALAAAVLFGRLAHERWGGGRAASVAAAWFALGATATLLSGRLTFLLGVAIGLGAALALARRRPGLAALLAVPTALASPVAGLFLALAAVAWGLAAAQRTARVWGATIAAAGLAPIAVLSVLFPEGGTEPFVASAFWPALVTIAVVAAALPARERVLRAGAAIYALGCVATFAVPSPLGGNVTRLGSLLAGPVLAGALLAASTASAAGRDTARPLAKGTAGAAGRAKARPLATSAADRDTVRRAGSHDRRKLWAPRDGGWRNVVLLAALALPLAYWQAYPTVRDLVRASGDPSTRAAYYAPLVRFLASRPGSFRVEIPFTANHWEAAYVAGTIALARGWERQLDRRYGALFYDGSLTAATYRAWLDARAVAYVALPDVALDYSAQAEARLIEHGLPYLRPVWHDAHWRVFAVRRPAPMVRGSAGATVALQPAGFVLHAPRAGDAIVRVHDTRWWAVTSGRACVQAGPDATTRVRVLAPGPVRVRARLFGSACRR